MANMAKTAKIIRKYLDFSIIFAKKNPFLSKFLPKKVFIYLNLPHTPDLKIIYPCFGLAVVWMYHHYAVIRQCLL